MRATSRTLLLVIAAAAVSSACSNGSQANTGVGEPLQISGQSQFIRGALPGTPPPPVVDGAVAGGSIADGGLAPLSVTSITFTNAFVISGYSGTGVSGLVSSDAVAVGVGLANEGSGYWVIPTQGEDVQFPGQRDFSFSASFDRSDSPGNALLRVVALGAGGNGGVQANGPLCLEARVPDNGHACLPSRQVPAAVFSLTWDTAFDVDLVVQTPSGRVVNPKTALTSVQLDSGLALLPSPEAVGLYDGTTGVLDRDSIGNCVVDGWREEDLVFQDAPPSGTYDVYADPFSACGQAAVHFTFTIYEPGAGGDLEATFTRSGELLASGATGGVPPDGGAVAGLFVAEKDFD